MGRELSMRYKEWFSSISSYIDIISINIFECGGGDSGSQEHRHYRPGERTREVNTDLVETYKK